MQSSMKVGQNLANTGEAYLQRSLLSFSQAPRGSWKSKEYQRSFLDKVGKELGVRVLDDWYKVSREEVKRRANFVSRYYRGSVVEALKQLYPTHNWDELSFSRVPHGFWNSLENQKKCLEKIGREVGVKELKDWYTISAELVQSKTSFIESHYNGSLIDALKTLYPDHHWDPLQFSRVSQHCWSDIDNQREELDRIGRELGVKKLDDWYHVSRSKVYKRAGFITQYYNNSLLEVLERLYPQHDWDALSFSRVPQGYWSNVMNQKKCLERIGKQLGVKEMSDWYDISARDVVLRQKTSFINIYNKSLFNALHSLYPEHGWDPLLFVKVPHGFWAKESTQKYFRELFVEWQKQHDIKRLDDWYQLPPKQVAIFQRVSKGIFGTVTKMLTEWFPSTNWMLEVHSSSPERDLQLVADIKVHHKIGDYEFDIFVPEWNMAIEYQGGQHFHETWRGNLQSQMNIDAQKRQFLHQQNILLATVNHRWNGSWVQLKATLQQLLQRRPL